MKKKNANRKHAKIQLCLQNTPISICYTKSQNLSAVISKVQMQA